MTFDRKLTDKKVTEILVRRLRDKETIKSLGAAFGVSHQRIAQIAGPIERPPPPPKVKEPRVPKKRGPKPKLSAEIIQEILQARRHGDRMLILAERYGVCIEHIARVVKHA